MNRDIYLAQASLCRRQAAGVRDARLSAMLQEEYRLWLLLARHSEAIDATVRRINQTTTEAPRR